MALPVTITGISTAVTCVGPFKGSNGKFYFFGVDSTTATTLQAFTATDPTSSWASVATSTGFSTAINYLSGYQVGDTIHLILSDGTSTSSNVKYLTFSLATEAFVIGPETIVSGVDTRRSTLAPQYYCDVVFRSSDSQPVAFFNGARKNVSGTLYSRVYYSNRTGTNTWVAAVEVDANPALNDGSGTACTIGTSSDVHFLWAEAATVQQRTLNSSNVLQTKTSISVAVATVFGGVYDATNNNVINSIGLTTNVWDSINFASGNTPTLAAVAAISGSASGGEGSIILDGTTAWYIAQKTATTLGITSSTDDGTTWAASGTEYTGTTSVTLSSRKAGVSYVSGGNWVFPYIVNDNGTLKYNEHIIRSINTSITPTVGTLTLTGVAPSVVQNVPATPAAATLTLTGTLPVLGLKTVVPVGALTLTGVAPKIVVNNILTPAAGALTLTGVAPKVVQDDRVTPTAGALSLTGVAPAAVINSIITPSSAVLTLVGSKPVPGTSITVPTATLTLTSTTPILGQNIVVPATALVLNGETPIVSLSTRLPPGPVRIVRDYWDRDEWGRFIPGAGYRQVG